MGQTCDRSTGACNPGQFATTVTNVMAVKGVMFLRANACLVSKYYATITIHVTEPGTALQMAPVYKGLHWFVTIITHVMVSKL